MQNLKSLRQDKTRKFARRKIKVNSAIKAIAPDFRVVINKTNKYMKAQVLDQDGKVVACMVDKGMKGVLLKTGGTLVTKVQSSAMAGEKLAALLKEKGIKKATYDRNGHLYHGRVQAMADGLRKGGIQI
ncbi:MAG: 50S ribosomal protein L18 [candidate division SR1 bacterium CG_4_9_14_3_um_filter_40_9]|nr:MAG: 50S ribosomal protein L18 [candidate division SR1 bacterium CG_4_9_14_3_um_filter_40_9]